MRLVECVPNFSEGRNRRVIDAISEAIRAVPGCQLLDVDPGAATNRTVMTFVGQPEVVLEAAFQAIAKAAELIDMRQHQGAHPRLGATDVCPFIPVQEVTLEECAELATRLAERVGSELKIPVYLYADAARRAERVNLADIRKGEYEALSERLQSPDFAPDFGPAEFNPVAGATVIGARQFLIAYNVNLNTRSQKLATEIALNIRQSGRSKKDQGGKVMRDSEGQAITSPGTLKACKAVGWYIEEYEQAQVSINLVDYQVTSIHHAFEEVVSQAEKLGLRVTGSEIVGLIPLEPMLEAGRFYLRRQGCSSGVSDRELIHAAVLSMGLSDLSRFEPEKKIIEYRVGSSGSRLSAMSISDFADELASDSPAPGGGSVAALCGSLSACLSSMVANLAYRKFANEPKASILNDLAEEAQRLKKELLDLVDKDTLAFNSILESRRLPKHTEEEKLIRQSAIESASRQATLVPLDLLRAGKRLVDLAVAAGDEGIASTLSDAGVANLTAYAACEGAYLNVLINLSALEPSQFCQTIYQESSSLMDEITERSRMMSARVVETLATAYRSRQTAIPEHGC